MLLIGIDVLDDSSLNGQVSKEVLVDVEVVDWYEVRLLMGWMSALIVLCGYVDVERDVGCIIAGRWCGVVRCGAVGWGSLVAG